MLEAATGLALLVTPAIVIQLLLGCHPARQPRRQPAVLAHGVLAGWFIACLLEKTKRPIKLKGVFGVKKRRLLHRTMHPDIHEIRQCVSRYLSSGSCKFWALPNSLESF